MFTRSIHIWKMETVKLMKSLIHLPVVSSILEVHETFE